MAKTKRNKSGKKHTKNMTFYKIYCSSSPILVIVIVAIIFANKCIFTLSKSNPIDIGTDRIVLIININARVHTAKRKKRNNNKCEKYKIFCELEHTYVLFAMENGERKKD